MPPKDASKKKKRIAPQLLGPVPAAGGGGPPNGPPAGGGGGGGAGAGGGSSSGYKRLRHTVADPNATVPQLKAAIKEHNARATACVFQAKRPTSEPT